MVSPDRIRESWQYMKDMRLPVFTLLLIGSVVLPDLRVSLGVGDVLAPVRPYIGIEALGIATEEYKARKIAEEIQSVRRKLGEYESPFNRPRRAGLGVSAGAVVSNVRQ